MIKYNNNRGFTLVEVILTIAILSLIIVPLSSMFITSAKMNSRSKIEYEAVTIAQQKMEEIKALQKYDTAYISSNIIGHHDLGNGFTFDIELNEDNNYPNAQPASPVSINGNIVVEETGGNFLFKTDSGALLTTIPSANSFTMVFDDSTFTVNSNTQNYAESSNVKVEVLLQRDLNIVIRNHRLDVVNFIIKKNLSDPYVCNLSVLDGEIKHKTNILTTPIPKLSDYILYKAIIKVEYNGEELVEMTGYKVFDK